VQAGKYASYLARPLQGTNLSAVLIIHEIYGLNENIRDIARRFAQVGYVALAVDLFSIGRSRALCVLATMRSVYANASKSAHMGALDDAIQFLQADAQVNAQRLGVVGFCMGGGYAVALAVHNQQVKAASVFYVSGGPKPLDAVSTICPLVGSFPEKDFASTGQGQKLEGLLTQYQRPHDIKFYPDTKHSFFNDTIKAYNPPAATDAWQRTLGFFEKHIPG